MISHVQKSFDVLPLDWLARLGRLMLTLQRFWQVFHGCFLFLRIEIYWALSKHSFHNICLLATFEISFDCKNVNFCCLWEYLQERINRAQLVLNLYNIYRFQTSSQWLLSIVYVISMKRLAFVTCWIRVWVLTKDGGF